MKKILLIFCTSFCMVTAMGQAPGLINYQGVARNAVGNVLANQNIRLRLSVRDGSVTGSIVYQETRMLKTSSFGLFNVAIGGAGATSTTGSIAGVNWGNGYGKFLQVEMDPTGGNNYIDMGTAQLLSVPYALYADGARPIGGAGGSLTGTYPNPGIASNAITSTHILDNAITGSKLADGAVATAKIQDGAVTAAKLAPGLLSATGSAGGDLTGSYPNPTIANFAVTGAKIANGTITANKLAAGLIPTSLPPSGGAGGDLSGNYPNPVLGSGVVSTIKLADGAVNTNKIADGSVTAAKLAPGLIPTGLPPIGTAGGDLSGTYPNPVIGTGMVTTGKLADGSITTIKVNDGAITAAKLAPGVIPTGLPPIGSAGGDLSGTYPNPVIGAGAITTGKLADGSVTAAKLAPGLIPTGLPPIGAAGGDLSGTYPSPFIAKLQGISLSGASPSTGQVLKFDGTQWAPAAESGGAPTGAATGDLNGSYPAPLVVKIQGIPVNSTAPGAGQVLKFNGSEWAPATDDVSGGGGGGGGTPSGPAGGDLNGSYPNPSIAVGAITQNKMADNAVTTQKIKDNAVTTVKINDGAVTAAKLAPGLIPTSLPPTGAAGGDLSGTYPNPVIGTGVVTTGKLADGSVTNNKLIDGAVTTTKLGDGAVTVAKLADGAVNTNKIIDGSVTAAKLAPGLIPTSLPPTGAAGGDLSGTYPDPVIGAGVVTTGKLADGAVTTNKVVDGSITAAKLAPGVIPAGLPPIGTAGGDLSGTYPNPSIAKLQGITLSGASPTAGQVLKFDGTQWAPAAESGGGGGGGSFSLPFSGVANAGTSLFSVTNQGTGSGIHGINSSANNNAYGVLGSVSAATPGAFSAGVKGYNDGTTVNSIGVWGEHGNNGWGVYGSAPGVNGIGVRGTSDFGTGVYAYSNNSNALLATSNNGVAGYFEIPDPGSGVPNGNDAIFANNANAGGAITAMSTNAWGLISLTSSATYPAVYGINYAGGEAVLGFNTSDAAAAVIGRNTGIYAAVRGVNEATNGIGVLAQANVNGSTDGNALVAELEAGGSGNTAVFKVNNANVARIDHTGKGFFNGGTQVGGADVAEYFDVEGNRGEYEPGDVLVISETSDRRVAKSTTAYSTLVAGVYATKPGLYLTEENAEKDQLNRMVPMGVIGVIPVKVCLEGGPIRRGDLIVTSSLRGVAMKADPDKVKVGQVLGKALQDYNGNGTGKINVLVSVK